MHSLESIANDDARWGRFLLFEVMLLRMSCRDEERFNFIMINLCGGRWIFIETKRIGNCNVLDRSFCMRIMFV